MFSVQEAMRYDQAAFSLLTSVALTAFLLNPITGRGQEQSPHERIATLAHGSPMITVGEGLFSWALPGPATISTALIFLTMTPNNRSVACGWIGSKSIETRSALENFYCG